MSTIAGSCSKSGFSFIRRHQPVIRVAVPFAFLPVTPEIPTCSFASLPELNFAGVFVVVLFVCCLVILIDEFFHLVYAVMSNSL